MNTEKTCPKPEAMTRLLVNGTDQAFLTHIDQCDNCAKEARLFHRTKELGKQIPDGNPGQTRADEVLNHLLVCVARDTKEAAPTNRRVSWAIAAGIAIVIGVAGAFGGFSFSNKETNVVEKTNRGTVYAHRKAQYALMGSQPDEIIRLTDGTATFDVDKLGKGERFRIVTGDAEVEVRGTTFDVTARNDKIEAVRVISGKVEVKVEEQLVAMLGPGESWRRPVVESQIAEHVEQESDSGNFQDKTEISVPNFRPTPNEKTLLEQTQRTNSKTPKEIQPTPDVTSSKNQRIASPAETSFTQGWKALRGGQPKIAVKHFDQSVSTGGSESIVEDAIFWRAVAHDSAGQNHLAMKDLKLFLKQYPRSHRACEASAMLGRKLIDKREYKAAKKLFQRAAQNEVSRVRASAIQGLVELEKIQSQN